MTQQPEWLVASGNRPISISRSAGPQTGKGNEDRAVQWDRPAFSIEPVVCVESAGGGRALAPSLFS